MFICCLLGSKSFDALSIFLSKFEFADHYNGLAASTSDVSAFISSLRLF